MPAAGCAPWKPQWQKPPPGREGPSHTPADGGVIALRKQPVCLRSLTVGRRVRSAHRLRPAVRRPIVRTKCRPCGYAAGHEEHEGNLDQGDPESCSGNGYLCLGSVVNLRISVSKRRFPSSPRKAGTRNPVAGKYAFAANGLWIPAFAGITVNMTTLPNPNRLFSSYSVDFDLNPPIKFLCFRFDGFF